MFQLPPGRFDSSQLCLRFSPVVTFLQRGAFWTVENEQRSSPTRGMMDDMQPDKCNKRASKIPMTAIIAWDRKKKTFEVMFARV